MEWRPFLGALSARSTAYALTVLGAMYRWLIEQRYVLANPFAGIKVRGTSRAAPLATTHASRFSSRSPMLRMSRAARANADGSQPAHRRQLGRRDTGQPAHARAGPLGDVQRGPCLSETR